MFVYTATPVDGKLETKSYLNKVNKISYSSSFTPYYCSTFLPSVSL